MGKYTIALFVDSENCIRQDTGVTFDEIMAVAGEYGDVAMARAYVNTSFEQYTGFLKAILLSGFERVDNSGNVDTKLAVDVGVLVAERDDIDMVALAAADRDYLPIIYASREHKKDSLILLPRSCEVLERAATYSRRLGNFGKK